MRVIAIDTGSEKQALCEKLGAEKWIDFKTEKDIVKAVQAATPDGLGPHGAIVAASAAAAYEQAMGTLSQCADLLLILITNRRACLVVCRVLEAPRHLRCSRASA